MMHLLRTSSTTGWEEYVDHDHDNDVVDGDDDGRHDDVENEFNHGVREGWWKLCWKKMLCGHFSSKSELIQAAMESLLSEMETAGGSCSGDDCEASYEVTEL